MGELREYYEATKAIMELMILQEQKRKRKQGILKGVERWYSQTSSLMTCLYVLLCLCY